MIKKDLPLAWMLQLRRKHLAPKKIQKALELIKLELDLQKDKFRQEKISMIKW